MEPFLAAFRTFFPYSVNASHILWTSRNLRTQDGNPGSSITAGLSTDQYPKSTYMTSVLARGGPVPIRSSHQALHSEGAVRGRPLPWTPSCPSYLSCPFCPFCPSSLSCPSFLSCPYPLLSCPPSRPPLPSLPSQPVLRFRV